MKKTSFARTLCAATLVAACSWGLVGCSSATGSSDTKLTGGVAATVNGTEISEDTITIAIESVRDSRSLTDEDSWGQWLAQAGYTPETVRSEVLESYINQEIIRQYANERGVEVDSAEVDSYVEKTKENYDSDEKWQEALSAVGMTEDEYRKNIENSLLNTQLQATFAVEGDPSEENLTTYAKMYGSYYSGAKRSSHVLFSADDEETAQQVLDQINAGTLTVADAATQYSKDTGSAANGGDIGWDKMASSGLVEEYQTALDELEPGQISGLVTSEFGIHIIECTDEFTAPDEITGVDELPDEIAELVRQQAASADQSQAYSDWVEEKRAEADVVINDMPDGLPYYVDMSAYQTEDSSASSDTATDAATSSSATDSAADGATEADDSDAAASDENAASSNTSDSAKQPTESSN